MEHGGLSDTESNVNSTLICVSISFFPTLSKLKLEKSKYR